MELRRMIANRWRGILGIPLAAGVACVALLGGCGGSPKPEIRPDEVPGYTRLRAELGDRDFTPLDGRRIMIDPGHGGHYKGAVGDNGLTEAEVNLGVALYLRGLLEWAGADVMMTRTADYDFLTPADSLLASDLAARVALADSLLPEVFLSIHHNSTANRDPDINETQTYYPVGRDGADLDLARAIHKHLVRTLEISPAKIMAGNFHVLRNATVPAVLGEPAMISNPVIEGRLTLARSHELEAQAYFLGLLEYFAGGTPSFVYEYGDTLVVAEGDLVTFRFDAGGADAPGLDPSSVELGVDGMPRPVEMSPRGELHWRPTPEDVRAVRELELRARNVAGRAVPTIRLELRGASTGPWTVTVGFEESTNDESGRVLLTYETGGRKIHDCGGLELAPLNPDHPRFREFEAIPLPVYPGTRGWAILGSDLFLPMNRPPAVQFMFGPEIRGDMIIHIVVDRIQWIRDRLPPSWRYLVVLPSPGSSAEIAPGSHWRSRFGGRIQDPVRVLRLDNSAPVLPVLQGESFWLEADGMLPIFADVDHRTPWAALDSAATVDPAVRTFAPDDERTDSRASSAATAAPDTLFWQPLLSALVGKVVMLDPTGSGTDTDGTGPLGTRGADLNLAVAKKLASLLRGAGCTVELTRTDETWVPKEHKILRANRDRADLFLTIRRTRDEGGIVAVRHHHGSRTGERWAALTARTHESLLCPGDSVSVEPSWAYLLRHTACPALAVGLPAPATMEVEDALNAPVHQHATARALFLAIVALLEGEEVLVEVVDPATLLREIGPTAIDPARADWVRLDGNFFWMPPRDVRPAATGAVAAPLTCQGEPGLPARGPHHTLEVHAGGTMQLWALVRGPYGGWESRLLHQTR